MTLAGAVSLTEAQVDGLLGAYLERKKFESRVIWAMLGEAMKGKPDPAANLNMLAMMGFGIRGVEN